MIGHSLGGAAAVHLAARHPELVERLVLVEPALDVPVTGTGPEDMALVPEDELDRNGFERILAREVAWRRSEVRLTAPHALVRGGHRSYARQDPFDAAGIRFARIPGAAHFVMHDAPDALLTALDDLAP